MMRTSATVIEPSLDVLTAELADLLQQFKDAEESAGAFERKAASAREASRMRALEIGRRLIALRPRWPSSGPKAKGWGDYLASVGIDQPRAFEWMRYAGFIAETANGDETPGPMPMPTFADAGVRERSGEEAPAPTEPDDEPLLTPEVVIDRDTWCTPRWLTDALGEVDLDPCANDRSHVRAGSTFQLDRDQNGLALASTIGRDWRVFINPPYSNVRPWIAAYRHTRFCFLLKLDPSTKWFGELFTATALILIPKGTRIEFEAPPGVPKEKAVANQFPHALFYARVDDAPAALREQCFTWITNHEGNTDR